MYFRNFREFKPYILHNDTIRNGNVENIQLALEPHKFTPCQPSERTQAGFISPFGSDSEQLYHSVGNNFLFYIQTETRPVPASEVHQALNQRVKEFQDRTGHDPDMNETLSLRDAVEVSLQVRAFSKYKLARVWVDFDSMLVFVDSCTEKTAEMCLGLIRKAFGSLPVTPVRYNEQLTTLAHRWLLGDRQEWDALKKFNLKVFGDFSLQSALEPKQKMTVREFDFEDAELIDLIRSSNMIFKDIYLSSIISGISFKLRDDFSLKSVKIENAETELPAMTIDGNTQVGETKADEEDKPKELSDRDYFDAEFILMALEIRTLYSSFAALFGGLVK